MIFGDSRLPSRFWEKVQVDPVSGCWLWTGHLNAPKKYGHFWWQGAAVLVHVLTWTLEHGPVPEGHELDHYKCDVKRCGNPVHVGPATHRENMLRSNAPPSWNAAAMTCLKGHPLEEGKQGRWCRECGRRRNREYKARIRARLQGGVDA